MVILWKEAAQGHFNQTPNPLLKVHSNQLQQQQEFKDFNN